MRGAFISVLLVTALVNQAMGQHAFDAARHADSPTDPSLITPSASLAAQSVGIASSGKPCKTIFGYLPYWENTSTLRWDLLTHVACFSLEVYSDGTLKNTRGWPWTAVINQAKANNVKVILVVALFDSAGINSIIHTPTYKQTFFENMRDQMIEGDADGLNVDFESGTSWNDDMPAFLTELNAYLKSYNPDWELTIAGPAVNWSNTWDLTATANACDGIFIMGYAFAGSWSTYSGANAPFDGGSINILDTMDDEYAGVPTDKLILGVPYYGNHWTTSDSAAHSSTINYISSSRFYNDVINANTYGRLWDATSQTPWYRWYTSGQWHQVWYDDAESLGIKYDAALARGYQGVGMWALGYDEGRDELWDALEAHIGYCAFLTDFDGDGDADGTDLAQFMYCLSGQGETFGEGHFCRICDLDGDTDVDVDDLAVAQRIWGQ